MVSEPNSHLGFAVALLVEAFQYSHCDLPESAEANKSEAAHSSSILLFDPCPDVGSVHEVGVGSERDNEMRAAGDRKILGPAKLEITYTLLNVYEKNPKIVRMGLCFTGGWLAHVWSERMV